MSTTQDPKPITGMGLPVNTTALWQRYFTAGWEFTHRVELLGSAGWSSRWLSLLSFVLLVGSVFFHGWLGRSGDAAAASIVNWFAPDAKNAPAPALPYAKLDRSRISTAQDMATIATPEQATSMLQGLVPASAKTEEIDKLPSICNGSVSLSAPWNSADGRAGCRLSKDKDRLWIWSFVKQENGYSATPVAVMVLVRRGEWDKRGEPAWRLSSVNWPGTQPLPGLQTVELQQVPFALTADFPELVVKTPSSN